MFFEMLATPDSTEVVLLFSLALLGIALTAHAVTSWLRSRELAKIEPPTQEEIDEVMALRMAGPFHLSGRSSAVARHFEVPQPKYVHRDSGGRGCYEPPMVDTWRDDRTER